MITLFNRFKKNTAVVVYIQKASFTSLGYLVETEQQRQLTKIMTEGGRAQSDSPESQLNLRHWLFDYLNTHLKELVKKAYDVLNGPMPEPSDNCAYCKWIEEMGKL